MSNQKQNSNQNNPHSIIKRFQEAYEINENLRSELQEYIMIRGNLPSNRLHTTPMKESKNGQVKLMHHVPKVLYRGITLYDEGKGSWKELYDVLKSLNNSNQQYKIQNFMKKTHTISDVISFSKDLEISVGFAKMPRDKSGIPVVLALYTNEDDYKRKALNIGTHQSRSKIFDHEREVAYYMPTFKIIDIENRMQSFGYYLVQANIVQLNIESQIDPITLNEIEPHDLFIADKIPYSKIALTKYFLSKHGIESFKIPHSRKLLTENQVNRLFGKTPYIEHIKKIRNILERRTQIKNNNKNYYKKMNNLKSEFNTHVGEMIINSSSPKIYFHPISEFVRKLGPEGFRNPKVLTKDQMIRKIMTKLRKMTKPQLQRLMTKLNKLNVN